VIGQSLRIVTLTGVRRWIASAFRKQQTSFFWSALMVVLAALSAASMAALAQGIPASTPAQQASRAPRAVQAQRFLAERGFGSAQAGEAQVRMRPALSSELSQVAPQGAGAGSATWQALGPNEVISPNFGLVTGRVSSIAMDPSDSTGNKVYLGTTGGGVWVSQNAGTSSASSVVFSPLTDAVGALSTARDASISIGAVTVQPGATGVVLAGTGDPNDALDSYYGAGILRSTDGGNTWSLIQSTSDQQLSFVGEGFAGFAWSSVNQQLVVAAVSQAYEGDLANAVRPNVSYQGLYYSSDSGATWALARITDPGGSDVQGPGDAFAVPDGNAATSVVWNPMRQMFVAAVRYHGYYQSTDGATWTRLTSQPGASLTTQLCPTNVGSVGSIACPIFRGTLAVNPSTGDTFAWTVDANNQDQGIWQDQCSISAGACTNQTISFAKQWNTSALETTTPLGSVTIANGDYDLALAAVPSGQDTILLAGGNDVWKCSLASSCVWRNTTNATTCMSAQVAPYQHAFAWNPSNALEIFIGNDSGLWRSTDGIGESGSVCNATDDTHFENLNSGLGSLAEVVSMSEVTTSPYTMMAALGVNGTAGVKSTTGTTSQWAQVLGGEGGPVAIDPTNSANWYVNNGAGVSIHKCSQSGNCTPAGFGVTPVVTDADVKGDGDIMTAPAPFLVDPLDSTQLLVGTCRVWRGPADGSAWNSSNAISNFLDGISGSGSCSGDALIRTVAAMALPAGGEVIYAGIYGAVDGGATRAGHVFSATYNPSASSMPTWQDLTFAPVINDTVGMNAFGLDISSITIDSHDATGNTVYVTVEGFATPTEQVRSIYRSTDGGAHWATITSNLPPFPASSLAIDPQDANTVYIATDAGVYSTRQVATCATLASNCWAAYGTGLPKAPVVQLSAAPTTVSPSVLVAATYGRGIWQIPLWTAAVPPTTATVSPTSLTFASQAYGTTSSAQTVTLTNTGANPLTPTAITITGDFGETDNCTGTTINAGAACSIQVSFTPTQAGTRTGQVTISANVSGSSLTVALSGTGQAPGNFQVTPPKVSFGQVEVGTTSSALQVTVTNSGAAAIPVSSATATSPFVLQSNACGNSIAANSSCALAFQFAPTQAGDATGTFTLVDAVGTQTVALSGTGEAPPTDTLSVTSLTFSATIVGQTSGAQSVTLTNSGGMPLTSISPSVTGPFQVSSNCGGQLAGNSSCSMSVSFSPTAAGTQTGTLTVSDAIRTQTVSLTGTGLQAPVISLNPSSLSFGTQQVGVAGSPLTLTVNNTGGAPMANVGFQVSGQASGSFAIGSSTCGATLSNGSSCTAQVVFTPATAGANIATLTVSSSTLAVKAAQAGLHGTGQAASGLNVSPTEMAFSEDTLGQSSAAQIATISNTSSASASGLVISATPPFSVTQNTCGTSLGGNASCSVGIVFTPTASGGVTGVLTVSSPTTNSATVALAGTSGAAGAVQVQPALLNFPTTGIGASSGAQTVTVTNTGSVALSSFALFVSTGFQISGTTCTSTLAVGANCSISVTFNPASAGQANGNLTIASSSLAASQQVSLSGMGFDFTLGLSGSTSQTVASGQTANFTVTMTPMNGSSGTFTFACGSLPANASCSFNPSSEQVSANATGSVTVQVATGHASASVQRPKVGWGAAPLLCGFVLLPLAIRRKRKTLILLAVLAIVSGGASSCGGGGGGSSGSHGGSNTPPGTYTIPLTATANGISHQVSLSLTVD
jgi:Abnormal spindle-like microcephaly-assoc'd, ASPM-SPD-2-Hydin